MAEIYILDILIKIITIVKILLLKNLSIKSKECLTKKVDATPIKVKKVALWIGLENGC